MSDVTADDILNGAHALTTAAEVSEIFGTLPESLGAWVEPVGGVLNVIGMVVNTIQALETEERGAGYRGTAYGLVYGALGMGTPSATCSGSLKKPPGARLHWAPQVSRTDCAATWMAYNGAGVARSARGLPARRFSERRGGLPAGCRL